MSDQTDQEQRFQFAAAGMVNAQGRFEILAITAGEGNGWQFSEQCLRASLNLWEGVECFVDHGGWFGGRSIRDLGGVCNNPRWSTERKGILLDLHTLGPSGELIDELGRQILAEETLPKIGFSADVLFTAKGRKVHNILRILDLSLVFNPARGGAFVRAMNQALGLSDQGQVQKNCEEVFEMEQESIKSAISTGGNGDIAAQLQANQAGIKELQEAQAHQKQLVVEAEKTRQLRVQMCAYLLESGLNASQLPEPMKDSVRKQFENQVFTGAELNSAIDDARSLVSELQGRAAVRGPQITSMFSTEDQLQAAVDDLLNAPREAGSQALRPARLSGIKELYMMLTGDRNLYGGYYPDRVQLATTANFTGLVKNAMNKIVAHTWEQLGAAGYDWWYRVTTQEHFETLNTVTGTLVGTVATLPSVSEGGEYTELKVADSPETADFTKYGGYIPLTLELIDRDNARKLSVYPRELAKAGLRRVSGLVAAVFTDNSGVGPTMADSGALFNATAVTTAGGHANLLTTALSASQWEVVSTAVYEQPMLIANETGYYGAGDAMALDPRYCLVPRELRLTAMKILYPEWENAANIHSENMQRGALGDVVVVPEWTDANNWAAVVDPHLVPGIVVCERFGIMPEIFIAGSELSPAVFMNDEHRIKVRHFVAVLVQDFRPLHKSNVA